MGARKKTTPAPAGSNGGFPAVVGRVAAAKSTNPLDWLYLLTSFPNFVFGVLRRVYRDHPNSVADFVLSKLRPVIFVDAEGNRDEQAITAHRFGSVLPDEAPDAWDDPIVLAKEIEEGALGHEQALLVYVTLMFPEAKRLHTAWEEARAFALERLCRARGLPVIIVEHAPHLSGSANPPHIHLLCGTRSHATGLGLTVVDRELTHDDGEAILHGEWLAFRERWARR